MMSALLDITRRQALEEAHRAQARNYDLPPEQRRERETLEAAALAHHIQQTSPMNQRLRKCNAWMYGCVMMTILFVIAAVILAVMAVRVNNLAPVEIDCCYMVNGTTCMAMTNLTSSVCLIPRFSF